MTETVIAALGDVAFESVQRFGQPFSDGVVYGVDKSVGLTSEPRYQSANLSRYKRIEKGMFAYNPMRLNIGSIGFCSEQHESGIVSPDYVVFECNRARLLPEFLYFHTKTRIWQNWLTLAGQGSVRERIYFKNLAKYELFIPSLSYQEAAVRVLSALEDKIELNRRMNETLEELSQAIFRDWFVDFGPVRRKLAGTTDPIAILGGLITDPAKAATLAAVFPDILANDGLPLGWEWSILADDFRLTMGQSPPGNTYNNSGDGLPFFQGRTDFGFRYPDNRKYCSAPTRIAYSDDTLVSVRAPVGDLNMAWEECCIGRGIAAVRHSVGPAYTFSTMRHLQPELQKFQDAGTVFGAINKKQFEQLRLVRASPAVIESFEELAGLTVANIKSSTAESRKLAETRDDLLPRLMSGKVRIFDAEGMVA